MLKTKHLTSKFILTIIFLLLVTLVLGYNYKNQSAVFAKEGNQEESEGGRGGGDYEQKQETEKEKKEITEPTETPEAEETPDPKEVEREKEVEKVKQHIEKQIGYGQVEDVEVNGDGEVKIQKKNKKTELKKIKATKKEVIQVKNQGSQISLNINQNGQVVISNRGITVTTEYPVIINPVTSAIAIRTPAGIVSVSMNPFSAIQSVPQKERPSVVKSANLKMMDNVPVYNFQGVQTRKLFGIFPLTADIQTIVDSKSGKVLRVKQPWYFKLLSSISTI